MPKIKILHIIKSLGRGGAEVLLPETIKLHNQEKFEFHVIYFLSWKNQMVEPILSAGGKVKCFNSSNNLKLLTQYKNVMSYCKSHYIDLIHCHLPWSGFLGRFIFSSTKIPVVYTEHNIQERYHPATKFLNKLSFNFQSLALAVSEDVNRSIQENISPGIRVKTVLNGVNTKRFERDPQKAKFIRSHYRIPENAPVIGNIAVFRKQKNLKLWLSAFQEISKSHPEAIGLLVGAGPEEEELKSMIEHLGLTDKIVLPGLQTDTISYFSAIDIFMMSSNFEGLPIALLEAMSMKCAVVSTKAGGVVEVVRDKKDGLLCNCQDSAALASLCSELLVDKQKLANFKAQARQRVELFFSLEKMVRDLEDIYRTQLKGVEAHSQSLEK